MKRFYGKDPWETSLAIAKVGTIYLREKNYALAGQ
jgi:hypothetical protein